MRWRIESCLMDCGLLLLWFTKTQVIAGFVVDFVHMFWFVFCLLLCSMARCNWNGTGNMVFWYLQSTAGVCCTEYVHEFVQILFILLQSESCMEMGRSMTSGSWITISSSSLKFPVWGNLQYRNGQKVRVHFLVYEVWLEIFRNSVLCFTIYNKCMGTFWPVR